VKGPTGVANLGLINSAPIVSGLAANSDDLDELNEGLGLLVYGMIGWLAIVTLAAIVVFVVVHVKLSRAAKLLADEEAFSGVAPKKSRKKGSRPTSRPAPLSAGNRLPSTSPPGLKATPSFLDYDYAVSAVPAAERKSTRGAERDQLDSGLNVSVIGVSSGRVNT